MPNMQSETVEDGPTGTVTEHRWGGRIVCHAHVQCSAENDLAGRGRLHDVSMSGAFIETKLALPLYSQVLIGIVNEDESVRDPIRATVVRTEFNGVGIEWRETVNGPICPALGCTQLCLAAEKVLGPPKPAAPSQK